MSFDFCRCNTLSCVYLICWVNRNRSIPIYNFINNRYPSGEHNISMTEIERGFTGPRLSYHRIFWHTAVTPSHITSSQSKSVLIIVVSLDLCHESDWKMSKIECRKCFWGEELYRRFYLRLFQSGSEVYNSTSTTLAISS